VYIWNISENTKSTQELTLVQWQIVELHCVFKAQRASPQWVNSLASLNSRDVSCWGRLPERAGQPADPLV